MLNESAPVCNTPEHAAYSRKRDVFEWYYIDFLGKLNPGWNTDEMKGDHDGIITPHEPAWQFSGSKEPPSVVHKEALVSTQSEALAVTLYENYYPKWVTGWGKVLEFHHEPQVSLNPTTGLITIYYGISAVESTEWW